jgi:hypothetical protein
MGFQIAQGIDQQNQAKKQRNREAALQDKAETKEERADRERKQKKKAMEFQQERQAQVGQEQREGGLLSTVPGAKAGL